MEPLPIILPNLALNRVTFGEGQEEYKPLPAMKGAGGNVLIRYALTEEERTAVSEGRDILVSILTYGQPLQPQYLEIEGCPRTCSEVAEWNDIIPLVCGVKTCGSSAILIARSEAGSAMALCGDCFKNIDKDSPEQWIVLKYADQTT